ncbi:PIN domain-containing protein [Candidatus Bathyarchaeota archaeon]|nr:PIN domain-containing protein [Candidatus Bathyarchaeota archaeon]
MIGLSVVFDTEPLLAFYMGEEGDTVVEEMLNRVIDGDVKAYINIVNLTELYYILHRFSPEAAEEKTRNLRAYGIKVVPLTDDTLWRLAAEMKSRHPMSLADAYAAATAQVTGSKLIVGRDQEFSSLKVETMRIGPRESREEK